MSLVNPAVPLSVRVSPEMRDRLEELADATGRTKSFLASEAIASYLSVQVRHEKAAHFTQFLSEKPSGFPIMKLENLFHQLPSLGENDGQTMAMDLNNIRDDATLPDNFSWD